MKLKVKFTVIYPTQHILTILWRFQDLKWNKLHAKNEIITSKIIQYIIVSIPATPSLLDNQWELRNNNGFRSNNIHKINSTDINLY